MRVVSIRIDFSSLRILPTRIEPQLHRFGRLRQRAPSIHPASLLRGRAGPEIDGRPGIAAYASALANNHNRLWILLAKVGRYEEAAKVCAEELRIWQRLMDEYPNGTAA